MSDPYFIEVARNGCPSCGHDRVWTIVGPDGAALGMAFGADRDGDDVPGEAPNEAVFWVDCLNEAFTHGQANPKVSTAMVDRFLTWPLPESVCSDGVATMPGHPHRTGTNLLTANEARAMFEYVMRDEPRTERLCRDCGKTVERKPNGSVVISSAAE